jgi:iron complex outermembrane receptor protein
MGARIRGQRWSVRGFLTFACATAVATTCWAQPSELKRLTIEQLMDLDVTTAQRREEPVRVTPAAISVITGDDIRRLGVTTVADALQMIDSIYFSRESNQVWRIGTRGLNGGLSNKLLVMIDGRVLYSPLFTGVFWNVIAYTLDDVDRIEVIRGPGGTLWGANAVNGVVNIVTKHSRQTQGLYARFATGNEDRAVMEARYGGGGRGNDVTWRVYASLADRDNSARVSGVQGVDGRRRAQVGLRVDGGSPRGRNWMFVTDVFQSEEGFLTRRDGEYSELALHGRMSQPLTPGTRLDVQTYYRREYRRAPAQLTHGLDTFDVDATHTTATPRHTLIWGGGIRVDHDDTDRDADAMLRFEPADRTYALSNVFIQDEYALVPGSVFITLGTKYEHNAFSGGALQPNVRARWQIGSEQLLWGAVSRAVRRPTRLDEDLVIDTPPGLRGSPDFQPESVLATEVGYRVHPARYVSVDATGFHHAFDDLRSVELNAGSLIVGNTLEGRTHGIELAANFQPVPWSRTHVSYTWMETEIVRDTGSRDITGGTAEANDPHHLYSIRTSLDLPRRIELDAFLRGTGALPQPPLDGYTELTLRAGWHATRRFEYWMSGQDLLHDRHAELPGAASGYFERAFRVGITVRY